MKKCMEALFFINCFFSGGVVVCAHALFSLCILLKKIFCCSVSFHQGNTLFQLGHSLNQLESPEKT